MNNVSVIYQIQRLEIQKDHYRTNHILHLLLAVLSLGLWIPAWILVSVSNANERSKAQRKINKIEREMVEASV